MTPYTSTWFRSLDAERLRIRADTPPHPARPLEVGHGCPVPSDVPSSRWVYPRLQQWIGDHHDPRCAKEFKIDHGGGSVAGKRAQAPRGVTGEAPGVGGGH